MSFMLWSTYPSLWWYGVHGEPSVMKNCTLVWGSPMGFLGSFCKTPEAAALFSLQVFHHRWLQHSALHLSVVCQCIFYLPFLFPECNRNEIVVLVPAVLPVPSIHRQNCILELVFNQCCTFPCQFYGVKLILLTCALRTQFYSSASPKVGRGYASTASCSRWWLSRTPRCCCQWDLQCLNLFNNKMEKVVLRRVVH